MSTLRRPRVPVKKATPAQLRAKSAQLEQLLAQLKDMEDFPEGQRGLRQSWPGVSAPRRTSSSSRGPTCRS